MRRVIIFCVLLLPASASLWPQAVQAEGLKGEPFSYVGMTISDIIGRFGPPRSVYAARGDEAWQDDVVFVYDAGDFYFYGERVWQVAVKSVYGIKSGDTKAMILLVLGNEAVDAGDYVLFGLSGFGWPLSLRVSIADGRASAIYIYRPDY